MHLLVDGQHGGHNDAERGSAAAVKVADQRDHAGHHAHADHAVADQLHQLADDHVEHAGVGHDAEIQHAEHEQCGRRRGAAKARTDQAPQVGPRVVAAEHESDAEQHGEHDERNAGLHLALEQDRDDRDDAEESQNSNYQF